ncbi:hypothetical protein SEA_LARS_60 [Mycobacterium phage Lars]|uniref:Uncharacterized protein n=7 Tax=Rosebushvirus rosebush TaxID=2006145 RepID=A0A0Y0AGK3_9CAUD|nr:hypothetical protein ARBITER_59 [Mycobacterium phage Arbiter]AIK68834.1 hypothetical protein PBI_LIZLEMON_60 [Mycobacterium phage LizLemon]AMB17374.1 hypothetical protein SEA_GLASS_60 [Mycobacterium phage Glass]AVO21907.1 hypothetical protein SEA_KHETH_60 [Mycobacterium phage Kheth]AXQ52537.1 hypothetical protein SEA_FRENCHFRY_60 [Mycobacterium phage FrenchFry]QHB36757.1 hypothetical protein SEA_LEPHLEUR_60 [Mycobacterium phage Lephleur]QWY80982.1 hypothetical protein SEA_LARS_60 [Mycobact
MTPYPEGFRWLHSSLEAHARMQAQPDPTAPPVWEPTVITATVFLAVEPGTVADIRPYSSSKFVFRPTRVLLRFTDGELKRMRVSGPRVLKSGALSDRMEHDYQLWESEIEARRARDEEYLAQWARTELDLDPIFAAVEAYLANHPLPVLALAEDVR